MKKIIFAIAIVLTLGIVRRHQTQQNISHLCRRESCLLRFPMTSEPERVFYFSIKHGAFWFMQIDLGESEHRFLENLNAIDHEVQRSKEDFVKAHFKNYDKPEFPPAWKTLELVSFGTLM